MLPISATTPSAQFLITAPSDHSSSLRMGSPCHHAAILQAEPVQVHRGLLHMPFNTLHYGTPSTTLASSPSMCSLELRLGFHDSLYMTLAEYHALLPPFRTNALVLLPQNSFPFVRFTNTFWPSFGTQLWHGLILETFLNHTPSAWAVWFRCPSPRIPQPPAMTPIRTRNKM